MNVIFLTLVETENIEAHGIYTDLLRLFRNKGHNVYVVYPYERRTRKKTTLVQRDGVNLLGVKILNIQKTNIIEKGISTVLLEYQYISAIKKYINTVSFDLILYSTPPITLAGVVNYLKSANKKALTYLLLKDIFPQNAVDLGMISNTGFLYKWFRKKEV